MPIQLDKILADIAEEKPLHPFSTASKVKKDHDEAWIRVGKKNKLSVHEAKSIFKVLQKKYEQEKMKVSSTWKLYQQMEDICRKEEVKPKIEPEEAAEPEEESFVEFLEVREEDEEFDGDSDNQDKSMKSNSSTGSPEKDNFAESKPEQKLLNTQMMIPQTQTPVKPDYTSAGQQKQMNATSHISNALQKKGISMRKTLQPIPKPTGVSIQTTRVAPQQKPVENLRPVLSEAIKRKAPIVEKREEQAPPIKKCFVTSPSASTQTVSTTAIPSQVPAVEIKQEIIEEAEASVPTTGDTINVITIPPNPSSVTTDLSNGVTTIKTNGFNAPRIEDLDFQKDIIFDSNPINSTKPANSTGEIINIGNFDNQLPPTFFKNLCNSQRHEALGLYVANVMNRVSSRSAAKLELNILKAIIDAQSDELARL